MTLLPAVVGALLLLLLCLDVFATVFSSAGRGGPVNRRQNQLVWALFRRLARGRSMEARGRMLNRAGPALVVSTLGVWVFWFVAAFALVYYPWMESFLVSPGGFRGAALEALYFSGYTAATLGLGDLVPDTSALRLLTVVQAFGGFALLSIAVTYFLSVYRELIRKGTLALTIRSYFGGAVGEPAGTEDAGGPEATARWCESLVAPLGEVLVGHHQYPVLHYFRQVDSDPALPIQLGRLVELRRAVRGDDPPPPLVELGRHNGYRSLEEMLERYLREVDGLFIPAALGPPEGEGPEDPVERAYDRLLLYMMYR